MYNQKELNKKENDAETTIKTSNTHYLQKSLSSRNIASTKQISVIKIY